MCCVVIRSEEHGSMKIESNRIIQYICFQQIQSSSNNNNNSDLIEFRDEKERLQRVLNIILYIHLRFVFKANTLAVFFSKF